MPRPAQAMLAVHDTGQLLRFVQRRNVVDLTEGRAVLREAGRYSEMVALLQACAAPRVTSGSQQMISVPACFVWQTKDERCTGYILPMSGSKAANDTLENADVHKAE